MKPTRYDTEVNGSMKCGNNRGVVTIGFRIEETLLEAFKAIAAANRRTVSSQLRAMVKQEVGA